MRLKLVLLTSFAAAVVGAGASVAIIVGSLGSWAYALAPQSYQHSKLVFLSVLLPPWIAAIFGGIFVYRHTSHRRKLQTIMTTCLAVLLCIALLRALTFYYS